MRYSAWILSGVLACGMATAMPAEDVKEKTKIQTKDNGDYKEKDKVKENGKEVEKRKVKVHHGKTKVKVKDKDRNY